MEGPSSGSYLLLRSLAFALLAIFLIQCFLQVLVQSVFLVPPSCGERAESQHRSPRRPLESWAPVVTHSSLPDLLQGSLCYSGFSLDLGDNTPCPIRGVPPSPTASSPHTQVIRLLAVPMLHVPHRLLNHLWGIRGPHEALYLLGGPCGTP